MEPLPYPDLKLSSDENLNLLTERSNCPKCHQSRKYFCYTCYIPVEEAKDKIPNLKLPIKVDVIKHVQETNGKSTAIHAAVIPPDDVSIYTYPNFPAYDQQKVLLVYPGKNATTLEKLCETIKEDDTSSDDHSDGPIVTGVKRQHTAQSTEAKKAQRSYDTVIFIDCTWRQVLKIISDPRLANLPCVELEKRNTKFWRCQKGKPDTFLATIEAIYFFLVEYHQHVLLDKYNGQYDDLLFLFTFMYKKVIAESSNGAFNKTKDG